MTVLRSRASDTIIHIPNPRRIVGCVPSAVPACCSNILPTTTTRTHHITFVFVVCYCCCCTTHTHHVCLLLQLLVYVLASAVCGVSHSTCVTSTITTISTNINVTDVYNIESRLQDIRAPRTKSHVTCSAVSEQHHRHHHRRHHQLSTSTR